MTERIVAIVAEDEAPQRRELCALLAQLWPELHVAAQCADGHEALLALARHQPQVAFLDIRMPGVTGLEVARAAAQTAHVVLVTAYEDHALAAFESGVVDYLVKPVKTERLAAAIARLKTKLAAGVRQQDLTRLLDVLRDGVVSERPSPLRWITATAPGGLRMVSVDDIRFLQAEDKYVRVGVIGDDVHIRTPLKAVLARLDPDVFWQIHRGTVVRVSAIRRIFRDEDHRLRVLLTDNVEPFTVSAAFENRFRGM